MTSDFDRKTRHYLVLLKIVFFLTGFSSLIYQVAWQRILTLYYGVGSISIALVVSIFMLGLGLGALAGGYLAEKFQNRVLLYFIIEFLIGCFGLLSIPFLDFLGRHTAGCSYMLTFFCMAIFLCVPTLLMGITLPILIKIINKQSPTFLHAISFLYFVNTLGAAAGAVLTGYFIISFLGLDGSVYFASVINFISAGLIFISMRFNLKRHTVFIVEQTDSADKKMSGKWIYALVFIAGFLAIGYEIIWLRIIRLLVKASPYMFSSTLSIYLLGIALGSFYMGKYSSNKKAIDKKNLFFLMQFLIGLSVLVIVAGYFYLTQYTFFKILTKISFSFTPHPSYYIPADFSFFSLKDILTYLFQLIDVFFWPVVFILIPAIFMGAIFPLLTSLAHSEPNKEGKTVGRVYFLNTVGGALGGMLTGYFILPRFGTEIALLWFSLAGIFFGFFVTKIRGKKISRPQKVVPIFILLVMALIFFPKKTQLSMLMHAQQIYSNVALLSEREFEYVGQRADGIMEYFPRKSHLYKIVPTQKIHEILYPSQGDKLKTYIEENIDGVIVATQLGDQIISYINGIGNNMRSIPNHVARVIETLTFSKKIETVLVIGCGTFFEPLLGIDEVKKITVVEVNEAVIKNLKKINDYKAFLDNKKVELVIDDGRRFLQRERNKYDVVIMGTVRATDSYANNLNSQEFFMMIKEHLSPGGVLMFWTQENRVLPKTILSVFKYLRFYDTACLASAEPFAPNLKRREELFLKYPPLFRAEILAQYGEELSYLGDEDYVKDLTGPYPVNQDYKPVLEYYLGYKIRKKFFIDPYQIT